MSIERILVYCVRTAEVCDRPDYKLNIETFSKEEASTVKVSNDNRY